MSFNIFNHLRMVLLHQVPRRKHATPKKVCKTMTGKAQWQGSSGSGLSAITANPSECSKEQMQAHSEIIKLEFTSNFIL